MFAASFCSYWVIWRPEQHRVRHLGSEDAGAGAPQPAGHVSHLDVCVWGERYKTRCLLSSVHSSPVWPQPLQSSSPSSEPCEPRPLPAPWPAVLRRQLDFRQRQPLQHQPLLSPPILAWALVKLLSLVVFPLRSQAAHSFAGRQAQHPSRKGLRRRRNLPLPLSASPLLASRSSPHLLPFASVTAQHADHTLLLQLHLQQQLQQQRGQPQPWVFRRSPFLEALPGSTQPKEPQGQTGSSLLAPNSGVNSFSDRRLLQPLKGNSMC